jgi:hypothetical protein
VKSKGRFRHHPNDSRLVGEPYLGIMSGLTVIRPQAAENLQIGLSMFGL